MLEAIDAVAALDGAPPGTPGRDAAARPEVVTATAPGTAGGDAAVGDQDGPDVVDHLEEELGDLLFQVYFHATLAAEAGRFTLADVARGVHDKLVSRHPHVFGDATADTPEAVASGWEARKLVEKGRTSVTEGIPAALPSLALAAKLQRKALAVGMVLPGVADEASRLAQGVAALGDPGRTTEGAADGEGGAAADAADIGELLFGLVHVARTLGVDPETALRARATTFRRSVEAHG